MSRRKAAQAADEWAAWATEQEERYPPIGGALVTIAGTTYAATLRLRSALGGALVTLETGETRYVPSGWWEEV